MKTLFIVLMIACCVLTGCDSGVEPEPVVYDQTTKEHRTAPVKQYSDDYITSQPSMYMHVDPSTGQASMSPSQFQMTPSGGMSMGYGF